MKKSTVILFVVILSACSNLPVSNTPQPPIAFSVTNTSIPLSQAPLQSVYNNSKYGYSINYPDIYSVTVIRDDYVEIGSKITVEVMTVDPAAPRGDGAVIEGTSDVQFSSYPAKLLTGYIGSVGGYMPQQFRKIVVEQNGNYFVITLYALGLHVTDGDISQIAQLVPEDVSLFDEIAESLQIH